jgi:type IV secretory pathway TrbD component
MNDAEIVDWARDSYGALWAGGVVSIVGALLLGIWGVVLVDRLDEWSRGRLVPDIARASVQLTAGVLSLSGIAQLFSGTASMPGEHLESESFVPMLSILYGNVAASAWCLLAPAAICAALAGGAPRWMRIASGVLASLLLITVVLPPVSWPFGMLWVIVTSIALLTTPADVTPTASPVTASS